MHNEVYIAMNIPDNRFIVVLTCFQLVMVAGMGAAIAIILAATFATHSVLKEGGELWSESASVAYHLLAHNAMGIGLAWITIASVMGYGGRSQWERVAWITVRVWECFRRGSLWECGLDNCGGLGVFS